jgi:hypothetical protein
VSTKRNTVEFTLKPLQQTVGSTEMPIVIFHYVDDLLIQELNERFILKRISTKVADDQADRSGQRHGATQEPSNKERHP